VVVGEIGGYTLLMRHVHFDSVAQGSSDATGFHAQAQMMEQMNYSSWSGIFSSFLYIYLPYTAHYPLPHLLLKLIEYHADRGLPGHARSAGLGGD
jgi:hypothetical protein